jgi:hypothetical protein
MTLLSPVFGPDWGGKMIKKIALVTAVLLLVLLVLSSLAGPVTAQGSGSISIANSTAQMDFPLKLNFASQISSNVNITDIRLRYQIEQMSFAQVTSEAYVNFTAANSVAAKYTLDMRKIGGLPPGAYVDYWWVAIDKSGARLESKPAQYQIKDNRYTWRNLQQGKINLFWYQGNDSFAQSLMTAAQQALVKLANDTGATPDKVVNIYIYASAQDLQGSMIYPNEWTGGVAFTQYAIIAIGISPANVTWGQGAMTHELTHNVIYQVTFNPYNDLPTWLNEGLAMYSEGALTSQFTLPLQTAIKTNNLISVRSIVSPFSAYADKANLSYAESETLVEYLIKQYGSNKMLDLLKAFKQGSLYDVAFQTVYGFDMDGLNNQWKTWVATQYGK